MMYATIDDTETIVLDLEIGRSRLGPSIEEYLAAVDYFLAAIQESLLAMHRAILHEDFRELQRLGQYVRTLSATMGASELESCSRQMERAIQSRNHVEADIFLGDISRAFGRIRQTIAIASRN